MKKLLIIFLFALVASCTSKQTAPTESTQDSITVVIDSCQSDSITVDTVGVV